MKKLFKVGALSMCVAMSLTLAACGGGGGTSLDRGKTETTKPEIKNKYFVGERPYKFDAVPSASKATVVDYKMGNVQGKQITTSAVVLFPEQAAPEGGYRIVVWQHGTLGNADACAPTNSGLTARYVPLLSALLEEGYVVVAPDYEGSGSEGIHPYLHIKSQAISSINAVKAAQEHYKNLSTDWMTIGQSQGGQASLGTAEYIESTSKDPNYKGAVAGAPANSLKEIILDIAPAMLAEYEQTEKQYNLPISYRQANGTIGALGTLLAYNALYVTGLKASYPDFDYSDIFDNPSTYDIVRMAEGTTGDNGICLSNGYTDSNGKDVGLSQLFAADIAKFLTDNPDASVLDYPRNNRAAFDANTILQESFKDGELKAMKLSVPVMVIQGTADTSVPYPMTERLVGLYEAAKTNITFIPSKDSTHSEAIMKEKGFAVDFIKTHMPTGYPVEDGAVAVPAPSDDDN